MIAFVLGATGATGRKVVEQLLLSEQFSEVHVFTRRQPSLADPKLHVHVMDFERPSDWQLDMEADIAFSCLGTTIKDAGSREAQRRVDVDYQLQFARMARRCGVKTFVLQSSFSANPDSRYFYMRIKGEVEEGIKALGFTRTLIFRPGLLDRGADARLNERIGLVVIKGLNALGLARRHAAIPTTRLAEQMVKASQTVGLGVQVYSLQQIHTL